MTHARELPTPLLIHTNTNHKDAKGKKFEYKIYQDAPGGHYFNRTLAGYLHPASPW